MNDQPQQKEGLMDQVRNLIRDVLEYLNSLLTLQQARFTSFALSGFLVVLKVLFACVLGLAAFVLFNVALGIGLARLLDNTLWAVTILGVFYTLLAVLLSYRALRWLKKLKS